MKIVRLDIDENSVLAGIDAVALVEQPAIEEDFIYFSKHKEDEFQETYTDYPQAAVDAAKTGIKRNEALGNKCGTQVGKVRAQQLAQRKPISLDTVRRMRAFLIRQKDNYDLAISRKDYDACGYISYLLWGGPAALPWAEKILRQNEEEFAEIGPRGGIKESKKAPKSKTPGEGRSGSKTNKPGAAATSRGVKVPQRVEKALQKKSDDFNERYKDKLGYGVSVAKLRTVYQRGVGAYQTSHSPNVKSAEQWGQARVNAFLYLVQKGRPQNKKYTTDYDLLPKGHPKKEAMEAIVEGFLVEKLVQQYYAKSEIIDGIQTYTTKEEALEAASKAGIEGYHTHKDKDGNTVYMPGATHSESQDALLQDAFAAIDEEQVLVGPLMTPNKLIKRRDADGEYYVYFTEETIKKLAYKSMKDKIIDRVNLEHDNMEPVDAYMVETWLVEDPKNDKALKYGYTPKMGQWFAAYKVDDRKIWEDYVKTGMVKGFSVEGMFQQMLFSKTQCRKNGQCACGQTNHPGGLCDGSHLKLK